MLLGLSKIIDCPGQSVPFSVSMDLSDLCYGVSYPVTEPVVASGTVRNTASQPLTLSIPRAICRAKFSVLPF